MERRKNGISSIAVVIFTLCAVTETGAFFFFLPEVYYPYFYPPPPPPTTTTTTTTTTPAPTTKKVHPHTGYVYHLPPGDSYHNSGPWDHGGSVWLEDYPRGYQHTTPPPPTTTKPPPTTTPAPTKPPKSYGHYPVEYPYESHGPPSSDYGGNFHHSNPWESDIWEEEYEGYPPVTKPPPTTPKPSTTTPPPPTTPAPTKPAYKYVYPRIRYNPYHSHKGYGPPSHYTPPPPTTTPTPPPTTPPPPPPTTLEYPYPPDDDYPPPHPPPKYRKYPQKRPPPNYNHHSPYSRRPKGPPSQPPSDYKSYGDDTVEHQSPKPTRIPVPPPPWLAKDKAPKKMPEDNYESDTAPPGYYHPSSNANDYEDHGYETDKPPPAAPPVPHKRRKYPSSHGNSYRGKAVYSHTPPITTPAPVSTPNSYNMPIWQYRQKNKQASPTYSLTTPPTPTQTTLSPYLLPPEQSFNPPPYSHYHYQPIAAVPIFTYNGSQILIPSYPLQYNYSFPTSAPLSSSTPAPQSTTTPQHVYQHNPYPILNNYPYYLPAPTNAPAVSSTPKVQYVLPQSYGTPEQVAYSLRNLTSGTYIPLPAHPSPVPNPPPGLSQSPYVLPQQQVAPNLAKNPSPDPPIQYQLQFYSLPQPSSKTPNPSVSHPLLLSNGNYLPPQQLHLPSNSYQNVLPYVPPTPSSSPPSPPPPTPPSNQYVHPQLNTFFPATPKPEPLQYQYIPPQLNPPQQDYLPPSTYSTPQSTNILPVSSQYFPPPQYYRQPIVSTTQKPFPLPSQTQYLSPEPNTPPPRYIPPPYNQPTTTTQASPLPLPSTKFVPPIASSTSSPYSPFSLPYNQHLTPTPPPSLIYLPLTPASTKNPPPPQPAGKYITYPPPTLPPTSPPQNQYLPRKNITQQYLPPNPYRSPPATKKSPITTLSSQYLPPQKDYTTQSTTLTTSGPSSTLPPPQNQYIPQLITKKPLIPSSNKYLPPDSYNALVAPLSTEKPQPFTPSGNQYNPFIQNHLRSSYPPSSQLLYSSSEMSTDKSPLNSPPGSLEHMETLGSSNQTLSLPPTSVKAKLPSPLIAPISRYLLPPYEETIPSGAQKNPSNTSGQEGVKFNIQRSNELLYRLPENFQNTTQIPFQSLSLSLSDASSHDEQATWGIGTKNSSTQYSAKSPTVKRSTFQRGIIQKPKDLEVYESHYQTPNEDIAKSTFYEPQETREHYHYPPSKIPFRPIPSLVAYNDEGHIPPYPSRANLEDKEPYEEEKIRNLKDSLSYPGIEKSGVRALSEHVIHFLASAAQAFAATARPIQE